MRDKYKNKICVVTGTRAEYGLLKNVINELNSIKEFEVKLLVTGTHLSKLHGNTIEEIIKDNFDITRKINLSIKSDTSRDISIAVAKGVEGFAKTYQEINPDLIIVLGDRYEILSAVIPACFANIPIAHIHGGERTEGLIDESIRHSITKFSHIHFVANKEYKKRVIQLGEQPDRVHDVGGLGIDAISKIKLLSKFELENDLNFKFNEKNILITYHPVTLDKKNSILGMKELINFISDLKNTNFIFTMPNADPENKFIFELINDFVEKNDNAFSFNSLGQLRYLSLIKYIDAVLGNSSSGLLEVPFMKKPTINIGERQKGRLKAKSVVDCEANYNSLEIAFKKIFSKEFQLDLKNVVSPYGNPGASKKIATILRNYDFKNILKKQFYDL